MGGAVFLCLAVPLGLLASLRAKAFVAVQLSSPATAAVACSMLRRRPAVVLSSTSGELSEASNAGRLRRAILRRARWLVAQTDTAANELAAITGAQRVAVVVNPAPKVAAAPLNGQERAMYCGRFSEEKDLDRLLAAWQVVASRRASAELRLVGAGGEHRSVEAQLRAEVGANAVLRRTVVFTGWVDDARSELVEADVFVLPSRSEGMSNALLEGCALARVVVASDIAPNRAILGEGYPLLFAVGDTDGLSAALSAAFDDGDVRRVCREHIAKRMNLFEPRRVIHELAVLIDA